MIRFILLLLLAVSAHAETIAGRVVAIADGDTLTVLDALNQQHKIRLAGIDAPEKAQAFGDRSKQNLSAIVFNRTVSVEWDKQDRYGRTVGKVIVNGVDANLEQIKAGMAWWYEKYRKEQSATDQRIYEQTELQAKAQRVGLWRDANPTPPWEFRHAKDGAQPEATCPCSEAVSCTGPKGGRYCTTETGVKKYR